MGFEMCLFLKLDANMEPYRKRAKHCERYRKVAPPVCPVRVDEGLPCLGEPIRAVSYPSSDGLTGMIAMNRLRPLGIRKDEIMASSIPTNKTRRLGSLDSIQHVP